MLSQCFVTLLTEMQKGALAKAKTTYSDTGIPTECWNYCITCSFLVFKRKEQFGLLQYTWVCSIYHKNFYTQPLTKCTEKETSFFSFPPLGEASGGFERTNLMEKSFSAFMFFSGFSVKPWKIKSRVMGHSCVPPLRSSIGHQLS